VSKRDNRLLFGPLAAAILTAGIAGLALLVPGYSHVRQTVSEIGAMDSPVRIPFTIMLCCVAVGLLIFAAGVRSESNKCGHSPVPAYLIICMSISAAGVGIFAFPHPLHNIFGESELVGYQAPLAFALAWRADPKARSLVAISWIFFVLVWISIALNLSSLFRQGIIWTEMKPIYGLIQRSLFAAWFCWCAIIGVLLWQPTAGPRAPD
jgi:hypothetical membrane protein